jgi:hypothetical protein
LTCNREVVIHTARHVCRSPRCRSSTCSNW